MALAGVLHLFFHSCNKPELKNKTAEPTPELRAESFPETSKYNDQSTLERILWNDPLKPVNYQKLFEVLPATIQIPEGMAFIPGSRQVEHGRLIGFFADSAAVTVGEFKAFVEATDYQTIAEIQGYSTVKDKKITEASWKFPFGPFEAQPSQLSPAVHLSLEDGKAYCQWKNKRLPTAKEWGYILQQKEISFEHKNRLTWTNSWVYPENTNPWLFVPEANSRKKVLGSGNDQSLESDKKEMAILEYAFPTNYSSSDICLRCVMDIETSPKTKQKSVNPTP